MTHLHTIFSNSNYITQAIHTLENGGQKIITSRRHRKGRGAMFVSHKGEISTSTLHPNPWFKFWCPSRLTWWVAVLFFIGSALFSVGGYAVTFPQSTSEVLTKGMTIDWIFFIGSIFFTSAAFCQLLESMNAGDSEGLFTEKEAPSSFQWAAWYPQRIGYMASLVQFIGTVMFNFNTGNIFIHNQTWLQQDILIWTPNIIGCICFLIASHLAFMEVSHGYWSWQPQLLEWWITVINLVGSAGFMISALYSLALPPGSGSESFAWLASFFTFQGGVCFLIASYLLLPEMFSE